MSVSFGEAEILDAIDSLLRRQLTMGTKVRAFEDAFADHIGIANAIMVNSGSSANLLAVAALTERAGRTGPVPTPAVTWPTSVYPLVQYGHRPLFVDVDPTTFQMRLDAIETGLPRDAAGFMAVHVLGAPSRTDRLRDIAAERGMFLVEDCCEALGTRIGRHAAGTPGDAGTYSFFFSHHITTGEGGMVVTDDDGLADAMRSKRAHGWVRDRRDRDQWTRDHPDIDARFLFLTTGYNVRPTEVGAAFGPHQLARLPGFLQQRRANAAAWLRLLDGHRDLFEPLRDPAPDAHGWFALPLVVREDCGIARHEVAAAMEASSIETRPILVGDFTRQPAVRDIAYGVLGRLEGAQAIGHRGIMIGNPPSLAPADLARVDEVFRSLGEHPSGLARDGRTRA